MVTSLCLGASGWNGFSKHWRVAGDSTEEVREKGGKDQGVKHMHFIGPAFIGNGQGK